MTNPNNPAQTNPSYRFPKAYRLLTPAQFRHVFDKPERKLHSSHLMIFLRENELNHPRLGLAITKKKVPTAVGRNRLKRLARENFRITAHQLKHKDMVIIAKRPIQELTKAELTEQLQQLFAKLTVNRRLPSQQNKQAKTTQEA